MFLKWNPLPAEVTSAILSYQAEHCAEHIDPAKVTGFTSDLSPYEGYSFCKLVMGRQRITITRDGEQERHDIYEGTESIFLVRFASDDNITPEEIIPLNFASATIYALNKILDLKIKKEDAVRYMVFFGANLKSTSNSKFYFLSSIDQLECLDSEGGSQRRDDLTAAVRANFKVEPNGRIAIDVVEKRYPLLGAAYRFKIPVIYEGNLVQAKCVLSEAGVPEMKEDDPTTISGLDVDMLPTPSYVLAPTSVVSSKVTAKIKSGNRLITLFTRAVMLQKLFLFLVFPAYLLTVIVAFELGFQNSALFSYYEAVKESWVLTLVSFLIGFLFVAMIFIRFIFIELANFIERYVPNDLTQMLSSVKDASSKFRKQSGLVIFVLLNAIELFTEALIALNLFLYGVVRLFLNGQPSYDLNFLEVFGMIVLSVPLVGPSLGWVLHLDSSLGLYDISRSPVLMYFSSFLISTVATGLLLRSIIFSKKDEASMV